MLTNAKIEKMQARAVQILGLSACEDPCDCPNGMQWSSGAEHELALFVLQLVAELRGKQAEAEADGFIQPILNKLLRKIGGEIEDLLENEYEVALDAGADGERQRLAEWLREQGKNDVAEDVIAEKHNH